MQTYRSSSPGTWLACLCALAACTDAPKPDVAAEAPLTAVDQLAQVAGSRAVVSDTGVGQGAGLAALPQLKKRSTSFIGKLAGGNDQGNRTLNMIGTDLGISFQRGDQMYFLFGDSWTPNWAFNGQQDLDGIAWTSAAAPTGVPQLTWERNGNRFHSLALPGFNPMGLMSVPVEGLVVGTETYIFFYNSAGKAPNEIEPWAEPQAGKMPAPTRSVLARATGNGFKQLQPVHDFPSTRFLSVSTIVEGDTVWIYGAGSYRNSAVYLAQVAARDFEDRSKWRYYAGPDDWRESEEEAAELFDDSDQPTRACVGELSVRKFEAKSLYFMAYNCGIREVSPGDFSLIPQQILLRTALSPEGPWSTSELILTGEDGFGTVIHGHTNDGLDESHLYDLNPATGALVSRNEGNVYGPYLIPQWFSQNQAGEYEIIYTISTWNPYHVYLVKTVLGEVTPATP